MAVKPDSTFTRLPVDGSFHGDYRIRRALKGVIGKAQLTASFSGQSPITKIYVKGEIMEFVAESSKGLVSFNAIVFCQVRNCGIIWEIGAEQLLPVQIVKQRFSPQVNAVVSGIVEK